MSMHCTEQQFLGDVADHQIQIIREDGVHRHLRFRKPGTMCMHFDLITWPDYLCYTGDMGTYVFRRLTDMFEFFRTDRQHMHLQKGQTLAINPQYWSEKLQAVDCNSRKGSATQFDPERFKQVINEYRVRWMREGGLNKAERRELWEAVDDQVLNYLEDKPEHVVFDRAHDFHYDFRFPGTTRAFFFDDLWDHTFTEYTFHFLWCCYALAWGIKKYDRFKAFETLPDDYETN